MVIKVMVADDQALIRESLKIILSAHPDIEVVATVEDGNHVLSSIPHTHPGPDLNGYSDARHGWGFGYKRSQRALSGYQNYYFNDL